MTIPIYDAAAALRQMKTEVDAISSELMHVMSLADVDGKSISMRDTLFPIPVTIDSAHHEVHEGDAFEACVVNDSMGSGATLALAFKTAAGTKRMHLLMAFDTAAGGHLELLEGATWDAESGTEATIHNRKRETTMASSGVLADQAQAGFLASDVMHKDPSTLAGTAICAQYAFGANKTPAGARGAAEWILKPETQYAVRLTADNASNGGFIGLTWYEHTDDTTT